MLIEDIKRREAAIIGTSSHIMLMEIGLATILRVENRVSIHVGAQSSARSRREDGCG